MDSSRQTPGVNNKSSGIPRVSRLPVLRNKASQTSLQESVEPPKNTNATTRILKPPSTSSFLKPGQPASRTSTIGKSRISRSNLPNPSNHVLKSSTATTDSNHNRASSTQNRSLPQNAKTSSNVEDQENQAGPTSLDSFRAASQQDIHEGQLTDLQDGMQTADLAQSPNKTKPPRPSLSDRTMESIQMLPSTPKERRRSSFFSPIDSPMGPPPRPSSRQSRDGNDGGSRPMTSDGNDAKGFGQPSSAAKKAPASAKSVVKPSMSSSQSTPVNPYRRSTSNTYNERLPGSRVSVSQFSGSSLTSTPVASGANPNVQRKTMLGSRTLGAKSAKARPPLSDAFGPATRDLTAQSTHLDGRNVVSEKQSLNEHSYSTATPSKASSAALRQQIAAAKAAARKDKAKHDSPQRISVAKHDAFKVEMRHDPFNIAPKDSKHILRNRVNAARLDGKLNIAAMGLREIPDEVLRMYDATAMEESKVSWAEIVDLTRFIAADNEIEELPDDAFPDKSAEDFDMDDQTEGNQFGGLEMLDIHGNHLKVLPIGLRRLERLTNLNLAHNKLENSCLDIISQISSLKELRLGFNALSGSLPGSICDLEHLETLDLQSNRLLGLPEALRELVALKLLNLSSNQLTALPMEALQRLPISELDASDNALIASLFPVGAASAHSTLRTLKLANNSLATLTFDEALDLPQLRSLDITNNHLRSIPAVSKLTELITLTAADNKITELPIGFVSLRKLRNVNLSSNELRFIDPEIANMESLESLILASNPLRDKKFLTMNAADIKRDLSARLAPTEAEDIEASEQNAGRTSGDLVTRTLSSSGSSWGLKPNGILDLAGRGYSDGINDSLGSFLRSNEVKQLHLQSNALTSVPPALWLGQDLRVLNLSGNALSTDYLSAELQLPALLELNLNSCSIYTLETLTTQLAAPSLQTLNVTANRLSGTLPKLREYYSALTTLIASDNQFTTVTADSLDGFHTVNLASNNIEQLPAEIGLLWDKGLRSLEVGSNAFRMPNHRILEKGTEATLRWLKDKLPESHGSTT